MDTDRITFHGKGDRLYDLVRMMAALPSGALKGQNLEYATVSSVGLNRNSCMIYPLEGKWELDKADMPAELEPRAEVIDGIKLVVVRQDQDFYYIFESKPKSSDRRQF